MSNPHQMPYGWAPPITDGFIRARPPVTPGRRLAAALLDVLLMIVTLGVGWLAWAMVTWPAGQTPAKRLLGQVVTDSATGVPFGRRRMAVREMCLKLALNVVTLTAFAWVDGLFALGDRDQHRALHDRMANSIVVER